MGVLNTLGEVITPNLTKALEELKEVCDAVVLLRIVDILQAEAEYGRLWDTVVLPEGTLRHVPKDGTLCFNVRQSDEVPKGQIFFLNSK